MSADPLSALLDDVVRAVDEDLLADPGCPDLAAVLARAHELDPQRVPAHQVAEVAQWAPVVSIQQGHRRRRTRDDVELLAVIEGVRAHVEEDVALRLGAPPPVHTAEPASPRPRRVWALVLAAAAVLLVIGAGVLQGGRGRLEQDDAARSEAVLIGPTPASKQSHEAMPSTPEPEPLELEPLEPPEALETPMPEPEPEPEPKEPEPPAAAKHPRAHPPKAPPPTLEELDAAAHAAWRAGDLPEAERLFRRLVERAGKNGLGDLAYGDLFTLARQTKAPSKEAALWREYLERFPRGRFSDDARAGLCRRASGATQSQCWQRYLDDLPEGAHRAHAQRSLASAGAEP